MDETYYCKGEFTENYDHTETWLALSFGLLRITLKMDTNAKLALIRALLDTAEKRFISLPATIFCPPLVPDKSGYTIIDEEKLRMERWRNERQFSE